MKNHSIRPRTVAALLAASLLSTAALAGTQPPAEEEPVVPPPPPEIDDPVTLFAVGSGLEYQFRSSIDDGGRLSVLRFNAGVRTGLPITDDFGVSLGFRYDFDSYNFSGETALAPGGISDPWDDVHTLTLSAIASWAIDNELTVFGGPAFQFSRESGASWSDSFIGGGVIGASYQFAPELRLGGGVGLVSQIEDSARAFPVIVVEWEIIEHLRLTTATVAAATGDTGLELVYDWGGGLETAIGGSYRFRRFRLDDGGVGQDTRVPFWFRVGYQFTPHLSASGYVGFAAAGELRLEDEDGNRLGRTDYDPAPILGLALRYRF